MTVVYQAGSIGVVLVLVTLALVARRWGSARNVAVSAAGAAAIVGILILFLGSRGGRPSGVVIHGYYLSFPVLQWEGVAGALLYPSRPASVESLAHIEAATSEQAIMVTWYDEVPWRL